jgi:serine/threonine protein kinase
MPTRQPFIEPGTLVADYQVESLIARGGMGEVYLARDTRLERWVALKVLPDDLSENEKFRSRFIRESRLAASVDHPNIIPIYGAGEIGEQLFIAMRYVRGSDLRAELAEKGPREVATTVAILRDTAAALDAAHAAGLIHRDVKPANILLADDVVRGPRGHVYLSDFGLTRRSNSASGLTTAGHFMGTLDYVAPEQIRGGMVDGRADVYALACVAFEMLVGHPPFRRDDDTALLWAHVFEEAPRISEFMPSIPRAVDLAVMAGLAKEPDERPSTCGDLVGLMDVGSAPSPGPTTATAAASSALPAESDRAGRQAHAVSPGSSPFPRPSTRRRVPVTAAASLVVVLLVGSVLGLLRVFGGDEPATFSEPDIPYTLEVPGNWTPRRSEAGDSTTSVLSEPDLRDLFNDMPDALEAAGRKIGEDPESMVGLAVYHRPFPGGLSRAGRLATAEALLPGESRLLDSGMDRAGDVRSQVMEGTVSLPEGSSLQTRVLAVRTDPEQLLVFFAPPSVFDEQRETFDEVADSLRSRD